MLFSLATCSKTKILWGLYREPWEFPRSDEDHHPSIVGAQRNFFEHSFDEYPVPTASIVCCRIIAIIVLSHSSSLILLSCVP